jgi:hypothetical protein
MKDVPAMADGPQDCVAPVLDAPPGDEHEALVILLQAAGQEVFHALGAVRGRLPGEHPHGHLARATKRLEQASALLHQWEQGN